MADIVEQAAQERPAPSTRRRKVLRYLLLALLGLEVVYLIAANVFLNTDLGPRTVNRKPEKWSLTWNDGWSIIPGHMHLNGMVFDQHARRQDFHAEAKKISFDIGLLPLARRGFVADDVAIKSLSMAITRLPKAEAETEAAVDGEAAIPEPPRPAKKPGWRIRLTDIDVDGIESVRLDDFETAGGQSRFRGDFDSRVRGDIALSRAVLEWKDAVLRNADEVLAEPLTMRFNGGFSPFNPRQEKGFAVLDHLNGQLEVEGTASRLSILKRFFADAKWIEALDGHGQLSAKLELEEGRLMPGSELIADADGLRLDFLGYATEGSGRVHGTVGSPDGGDGPARMEVIFDDFTVRRKPATEPNVRGEGFRLVATTSEPDLRYGLSDLDVVIDMPRAEVPDLSIYGAYLPPDLGLALGSGRGFAKLHLEASAVAETVSGNLELDADKIAGNFQDLGFEAGLEVRTRISGGDLDDFRLEIEGTRLEIKDGIFRDDRNTEEEGWWMTIDVPRGTAYLGGGTPWIEADVELAMRDTRVIIAMFAELKSWLQRFEKILTVKDVTGSSSVVMKGQHLYLRHLEIDGRKLHGRAELDLGEEQRRGILYVRFHGLAVGLERLGDEKDWKLTGVKKWFDRRVAESW